VTIHHLKQDFGGAVLNQALEDIFNVNTIIICGHEKNKVTDFFKVRTKNLITFVILQE
jgi:hypothetical protein